MANTKFGVKRKRGAEWVLFYRRGYKYKEKCVIN
jgi:hypothetical protein